MEISDRLSGRQVEYVLRSENVIAIHCSDGFELRIAWVGEDGQPVKGTPRVVFAGRAIRRGPPMDEIKRLIRRG